MQRQALINVMADKSTNRSILKAKDGMLERVSATLKVDMDLNLGLERKSAKLGNQSSICETESLNGLEHLPKI